MTRLLRTAVCGGLLSIAAPALADNALRSPGVRPAMDSPEAGLWTVAEKAEKDARQSAELNLDADLNAYVREVACKTVPEYCSELRVYVMDRPFFNAQMAPNGYAEVWSGLLLRATTEDELAFVLGHEAGHFAMNHSWESLKAAKSRMTGTMIATAIVGIAGTAAAAGAGSAASAQNIANATGGLVNAMYLGAIASLFSFSRENETDADTFGFDRAVAAGYSPRAGADLWTSLVDEMTSSDFPRVRTRTARTSVFDTHPVAQDRIDALGARAEQTASGGAGADPARHRAAIRPHLAKWLRDDLRRRDFGQTLHLINRLEAGGQDLGVLAYFRGEALRLRRGPGDPEASLAAYTRAIEHPDAPAEAWRELADLAEKRSDREQMADYLITYLQRAPDAGDSAFVRRRIERVRPLPAAPTAEPSPAATQAAAPAPAETAVTDPPAAEPPAPATPLPEPPVANPPAADASAAALSLAPEDLRSPAP
jgi:beta-barrel assembly-enhancing protease